MSGSLRTEAVRPLLSACRYFAAALAFLLTVTGVQAQTSLLSDAKPVAVATKEIKRFQIGRDIKTFGPLTFLGGLELLSSDRNIGGLSGIESLDGGQSLIAITDNGLWFAADVEQEPDGTPLGISNARYIAMRDLDGKTLRKQWRHDTEAMTFDGNTLLVAAEQANAIYRYPWPLLTGQENMIEDLSVSPEIKSLRGSKGLEAMAMAPEGSALSGTLVAIAERGAEGEANLPGFLIRDGAQHLFSISRSDRFDATDAAFLPSGDLLLLERRYNLRDLIGMRLRRFAAADIKPSAHLDGEILMVADFGYQIDNMEGLAVHVSEAGQTIVTLISDNNRSLLQRTLLLRFELSGALNQ